MYLNRDVLIGKWKKVMGSVRERRGELTHSELDRAMGRLEHNAGVLQERRATLVAHLNRVQRRLLRNPTS